MLSVGIKCYMRDVMCDVITGCIYRASSYGIEAILLDYTGWYIESMGLE